MANPAPPKFEDTIPHPDYEPKFEDTADLPVARTADDKIDLADVTAMLGQGATLGFGDELLGAFKALRDVTVSPDKKLADLYALYRQHQKEEESKYEALKEAHPTASFLGELAGGFLIPGGAFVKGGKAAAEGATLAREGLAAAQGAGAAAKEASALKNILSSAKTGATIGGLAGAGASKGNIEDMGKLGEDVLGGAVGGGILGGAIGTAVEGATKGVPALLTKMEESGPLGRNIATSIKAPARGEGLIRSKAEPGMLDSETRITRAGKNVASELQESLTGKNSAVAWVDDEINDAFNAAGDQRVQAPIKDEQGRLTPLGENFGELIRRLESSEHLRQLSPEQAEKIIEEGGPKADLLKMLKEGRDSDVSFSTSGRDIRMFMSHLKDLAEGKKNPSEAYSFARWMEGKPVEGFPRLPNNALKQLVPPELIEQVKYLAKDSANSAIPENAATLDSLFQKFKDVRSALPETILNEGGIDKYIKTYYGDMPKREADAKIANLIENELVQKLSDPSASGKGARYIVNTLKERIADVNRKYPDLNININSILKKLEDVSSQTHVQNKLLNKQTQTASYGPDLLGKLTDITGYGGGVTAGTIYRGTKNTLDKFNNLITTASDVTLMPIARKLKETPVVSHLGNALEKALTSKSTAAKNAAIFSIMQNPSARETARGLLSSEEP